MDKNYNKLKEKSLLLLIYSFLDQAIVEEKIGIDKKYGSLRDRNIKVINIYKKLKATRKSFANKKIRDYLLSRIDDPSGVVVDVVYIAIILLYFYRLSDIKRTISPLSVKEAKELIEAIRDDLNIDEIKVAKNFFKALFPEKEGSVEFFSKRLEEMIKIKN